jgi:hypothetical protein
MSDDPHALGDAPIEGKYRDQMNAVAGGLDYLFNGTAKHPNKKVGFVLLTFEYGNDDGRCNFISNGAERKAIVSMFKEMIARFEGMPGGQGRG